MTSHTITFDAMLPTILSTEPPEQLIPWRLPFKFGSRCGLGTREIGAILSIQEIYSMIATVFMFPVGVRELGALSLFRMIAISYPLLYVTTPYLVLLPNSLRMAGLYAVLIWKCTFTTMAYPSNAILLTNSAPSLLMLGTISGVAASTASLSKAFGPTVSGFLLSARLRSEYSGLAWWCSATIAVVGPLTSLFMTEKESRLESDSVHEEGPKISCEEHVLVNYAPDSVVASTEPRIQHVEDENIDKGIIQ